MQFLEKNKGTYITTQDICKGYLERPTASDINSTNQILNVLALAGVVDRAYATRTGKTFYNCYKFHKLEIKRVYDDLSVDVDTSAHIKS